jgi:hypothetical protein
MYIDHEWGVEIPINKGDGHYLTKKDLAEMKLDLHLTKMIDLWAFAVQNEMNWHNPTDDISYLPDYYYKFIEKLEADIINNFKNYNIDLIKN